MPVYKYHDENWCFRTALYIQVYTGTYEPEHRGFIHGVRIPDVVCSCHRYSLVDCHELEASSCVMPFVPFLKARVLLHTVKKLDAVKVTRKTVTTVTKQPRTCTCQCCEG